MFSQQFVVNLQKKSYLVSPVFTSDSDLVISCL